MELGRLGHAVDQGALFDLAGVDPAEGRGAVTTEMKRLLERLGFDPGAVWYPIPTARADEAIEARFAEALADLLRGVPSIVCTHFDETGRTEHFRVLYGYDASTDEVVYSDPAIERGGYVRMSRARFLALWPLGSGEGEFVVRLRLDPAPMRANGFTAPPPSTRFSPAAFAQHVLALRSRLPRGFSVAIAPPFVVVGDEAPAVVAARARDTVRWAVDRLKADFFASDPDRILDVWLFRDRASYEHNTIALFHEAPTTPYGFFSSKNDALLMNIATGGGTLVHEIVHPFVEADMKGAPPWLNEGLASLFEASRDEAGHIKGGLNWRLEGLQRAIKDREVPSFEKLTSLSEAEFYAEDRGVNYAASRYLLCYAQERGVLSTFYREMRAARANDPTGFATLLRVLGERDATDFQTRWSRWVMTLRAP